MKSTYEKHEKRRKTTCKELKPYVLFVGLLSLICLTLHVIDKPVNKLTSIGDFPITAKLGWLLKFK